VGLAYVLKRRKIRAYNGFCIPSLHFASNRCRTDRKGAPGAGRLIVAPLSESPGTR